MRILLCHNHYRQRGGEDESFAAEAAMLEANGNEVHRYILHNDAIEQMSPLAVAARTLWSRQSYRQLRELIRRVRPEVMHCTNTFPLISPSAYYAARAEKVRVVQSLRNYRLMCLNGVLHRDGRVCESCLRKAVPWPGVIHACYRQSRAGSTVVAGTLVFHRLLRTWTRTVDRYFTLTQFAKQKFVEGGLPADRIAVKPNFVHPDPGIGEGRGGYAAFVGRLSPEKGIDTLLAAWRQLAARVPLKIIGDGPCSRQVEDAAASLPGVEWLGRRGAEEVLSILGDAALLVAPTTNYETFGRNIIEAYAKGTPVVASRIGAAAELVCDGDTGLFFEPGNADDLAAKVIELLADPAILQRRRQAARREFEQKYTAELNYRTLMAIYQ